MSNNLTVKLKAKQDQDGETYYVGKVEFPGTINFKDGVVFLIFVADKGDEQIQIAGIDKKDFKSKEFGPDKKDFKQKENG